jgi:sodium transport system permease protein
VNIKTAIAVYQKEMLEIRRDRRTLISMVLIPVLVIPVIFGAMGYFMKSSSKQAEVDAAKIGVKSEADLGDIAASLKAAGFQLIVAADPRAAVEKKDVAAALEATTAAGGVKTLSLYVDKTREASELAGGKVTAALDKIKEDKVRAGLRGSGVPESILTPFAVNNVNVASDKKMGGSIFGTSMGYILIVLMVTGALYPAIDTAAGEKERRTLETLLSSPASRGDIIFGKVLACATAAFITAILALATTAYSYKSGSMSAIFGEKVQFDITDPVTIGLVLLSVIPLALLFASLMVAVSFFAKSYKEGQSYLTPLLMIVIVPAMLGMLPGTDLTPTLALIPVFNVTQIIKSLFIGTVPVAAFAVACAANMVYAAAAYFFATRIIRSEGVLFRV